MASEHHGLSSHWSPLTDSKPQTDMMLQTASAERVKVRSWKEDVRARDERHVLVDILRGQADARESSLEAGDDRRGVNRCRPRREEAGCQLSNVEKPTSQRAAR